MNKNSKSTKFDRLIFDRNYIKSRKPKKKYSYRNNVKQVIEDKKYNNLKSQRYQKKQKRKLRRDVVHDEIIHFNNRFISDSVVDEEIDQAERTAYWNRKGVIDSEDEDHYYYFYPPTSPDIGDFYMYDSE